MFQCDGGEQVEGKRPYIAPEELVYAQPVAINPVGRPIPTIPVKGVRGYGPPKPVPYPSSSGSFSGPPGKYGPPNKFGPPGPPGYGGKPPRRHYGPPPSKPIYGKPTLSGEIYEGQEFLSRPPPGFISESHGEFGHGEFSQSIRGDNPYQFEQGQHQSAHHKDKRVEITVNAQGGAATASGGPTVGPTGGKLEHVHHHYHHNIDGVSKPTVVVNPIPISAAAVSSSSDLSLNSFGSSFNKPLSSGFNPIGASGLGNYGSSSGGFTIGGTGSTFGPTIGGSGLGSGSYGGQSIANYGSSSFGVNSFNGGVKPVSENYGPATFNSFGTSVGSYGTSDLYKKELNLNSGNSNYLQSSYADKYQGLESGRAENYDCVCVPYDQCPATDVIGRKDDLFLPLDPRNLKSDIEAITDEERVITDGNGTMTVVRVPKEATNASTEGVKKVSKREAPAEKKNDGDQKTEGVSYIT